MGFSWFDDPGRYEPWNPIVFINGNLLMDAFWEIAILLFARRNAWANYTLWLFLSGMVVNAIGHPFYSLYLARPRRCRSISAPVRYHSTWYFPGLFTSFLHIGIVLAMIVQLRRDYSGDADRAPPRRPLVGSLPRLTPAAMPPSSPREVLNDQFPERPAASRPLLRPDPGHGACRRPAPCQQRRPHQILNMLTPAIGVLVLLLVLTPDGYQRTGWLRLALHRAGWRSWPLALLAPTVILAPPTAPPGCAACCLDFESDVLINLIINIVIISIYAMFEEIGWRGYLLPRLNARPGPVAPALVGFLHGVWHLPLMLLTTAYNPAGNRLITVPLFLAVLTGAGVLYGYLRDMSGSLWPVIIAHGTFNAVLGILADAAITSDPSTAAYLTGETGVLTLAAVMIAVAILTRRWPRHTREVLVTRTALQDLAAPHGAPEQPRRAPRSQTRHRGSHRKAAIDRLDLPVTRP